MPGPEIPVALFSRGRTPGFYSIERVAAAIRSALPPHIAAHEVVCPVPSGGIWSRLICLANAAFHRATVNHITGDISFVAAALPGNRTVVTIHDFGHLYDLRGLRCALFRWIYFTMPFRRCRFITVISAQIYREMQALFPWAMPKVRVVPDCLPGGFRPVPRHFHAACPVVLQIGTRPNKNLDRTVAALAGIDCTLHIVGSLSVGQEESLERHGVRYRNSVNLSETELLNAYAEADIVTFVSTYEGFGLPILEANAVGRPVVTSSLQPMSEVAGNAACLVDPYSVESIRDGLKRVIRDADYRASLIRAGEANVARYAPRAVAAEFAALYEELAAL